MFSDDSEKKLSDEFPHLRDICYLDHAGATLYAKCQLSAVYKELNEGIFGNPHSPSSSSRHTADIIDQVRFRILKYVHTNPNEYSVIFTSSATAALKLVAENFNWSKDDVHINTNSSVQNYMNCKLKPKTETVSGNKYDSSVLNCSDSCNCVASPSLLKSCTNSNSGSFIYLQDNHTSVLGMRELAAENGACVHCITHDDAFSILGQSEVSSQTQQSIPLQNSLFVYPAQCNFSGVKYPLSWIHKIQSGILNCNYPCSGHNSKWFCFLDAASFVSNSDLDLSVIKPDFVCLSFYKIFGYPTGLGALLVKNSSGYALKKKYFGGGTVQISLATERFHVPRASLSEQFEDGTVSFLSIIALRHGFDALQNLTGGIENVTSHTLFLAKYVFQNLLLMHHNNGSPAVVLYTDTDYEDFSTQGSIVNFNLLRSNGEFIGFGEVLNFANLYGIHLRTGCFCNPGSCQRHLKLSVEDLKVHFQAGHICGDDMDLIDGKPTGSVRVSFGYMSTKHDADKLLDMIISCFVDGPVVKQMPSWWPSFQRKYQEKFNLKRTKTSIVVDGDTFPLIKNNTPINEIKTDLSADKNNECTEQNAVHKTVNDLKLLDLNILQPTSNHHMPNNVRSIEGSESEGHLKGCCLTNIFLYPVKSCGPMSVKRWIVNARGLLYDREWMIVGSSGVALTQKREARMCLIQPTVDLENNALILEFEGFQSITVPLKQDSTAENEISLCESKVCGDYIKGTDCGDEVAQWLCSTLRRDGLRLMRQGSSNIRTTKFKNKAENQDNSLHELSLANQAQFLLVNTSTIDWLANKIPDASLTEENLLRRFRCNFTINGTAAFEENNWKNIKIGNIDFVVEGPCTRCQMVCIDQQTGERTKEPLRTLAEALHGKMKFGIYLQHDGCTRPLSVGDSVVMS